MKTNNIFLFSGKAGAGKDTSFVILKNVLNDIVMGENKVFIQRFSFADRLKTIAKGLFNWDGIKDDEGRELLIFIGQVMRGEIEFDATINSYYDPISRKIFSKTIYGEDTRDVFKKLDCSFGKRYGRFWVDSVIDDIKNFQSGKGFTYSGITDCRFKNEIESIKEAFSEKNNVVSIRIERPDCFEVKDRSETELDDYDFDYVIQNTGSVNDLYFPIMHIVKEVGGIWQN